MEDKNVKLFEAILGQRHVGEIDNIHLFSRDGGHHKVIQRTCALVEYVELVGLAYDIDPFFDISIDDEKRTYIAISTL